MTLEMRYEGKNIWGHAQWRDDWCYDVSSVELNAAFNELGKNRTASIVDVERSIIVGWDTIADYEQGIVTERRYTSPNAYDDERKMLQQVRREWRKRLTAEIEAR